ncbi:MAG: efflux RND transporter permease subunit [Marinobacter sp.]|nr:efflux RND transporter permease subunit [Marinobacter sp.]
MSQLDASDRGGLAQLSRAAIRRPVGTLAIVAVVVVIGLFGLQRLPVSLLPAIEYPQIRVTVNYPGVSPDVIENQVTRVLERSLAGTENVIALESRVRQSRTDVDLTFSFGTNLDLALQDAARNLEQARNRLPADIDPPRIRKFDSGQEPVWRGGFSSSMRSEVEVTDWVDNTLTPQLLNIPGVATVEAVGGLVREIEVLADQQRLVSLGLSLDEVVRTLAAENTDVSGGRLTSAGHDIQTTTKGLFTGVADIENVLLDLSVGYNSAPQQVRLGDVARVRDGGGEQRVFARLNGTPAAQVDIYKLPEANTVAVADAVKARLEHLRSTGFIPDDIVYRTTQDPTFFIRGALTGLSTAALMGGTLAMLMVLLFLGSLRKGFIVGLSIPVALLATFALMGQAGLTLNIISLGGLALGVGLLLDNAIVMLENIYRHRQSLGKSPEQAAQDGASEVVSAVTAGTLTNLAAVVPFLALTGAAALVFREMILTISFAILATLAAALTLVPMLAAALGKVRFSSGLEASWVVRGFARGVQGLSRGYEAILPVALRWRWLVAGVAVALMVGATQLFSSLGNEFLPVMDDGEVRVRVSMPAGTPPQQTLAYARQIESLLVDDPYVQSVFTLAGGSLWGGTVNQEPAFAQFLVQLVPAVERPHRSAGAWLRDARATVRDLDIPGARINVRPPQIRGLRFTSSGNDVVVGISGPDLHVLQDLGQEVYRRLEAVPGLVGLDAGEGDRSMELQLTVDRDRAAIAGLGVADIGKAMRTALDGQVATRFLDQGREYDIRVRLQPEDIDDPDKLADLVIPSPAGGRVLLRDLAGLEMAESASTLWRENQSRIHRVEANINTAVASVSEVLQDVQAALRDLDVPDGYGVILGGQWETIQATNREIGVILALAVFLVFAVLAVQYERITNPLVILLSAPLSLCGVAGLLWLTGNPVSAPVLIGMVLLIGVVVNNAILLVEYIEIGRRQGMALDDAIVAAGKVRLRPILMTTVTTVLGMMPLAIGVGEGSEIMQPLALAVVGGLSVSMLLTLIVVPCVYRIANGLTDALKRGALSQPGTALAGTDQKTTKSL